MPLPLCSAWWSIHTAQAHRGSTPCTGTVGSGGVQIIQFCLITLPDVTWQISWPFCHETEAFLCPCFKCTGLASAPLYDSWVDLSSQMTCFSGISLGVQLWWRPSPHAEPPPGTSFWSSQLFAFLLKSPLGNVP